MNPEFENKLKNNAKIVNEALEKYLDLRDADFDVLYDAMRYSALSGGKRIRAFLALEFFSLFAPGQSQEAIVPVAAAIEMIHTYSLIHDDLPCMDDDDLRRGLPSSHKKFGEATALLAGDALLTFAFGVVADAKALADPAKIRIVSEISRAAGHLGMIGGQMMDMQAKNKSMDIVRIIKMHTLKTANMIIVSSRAGAIAGGAGEREIGIVSEYAKNIGLAFQFVDDKLDGDYAICDPHEYAKKLTAEAAGHLGELEKDTENLKIFAQYLLERRN